MRTVWQDLRYALRLLRLNPGFASIVILSLALGIGANTAIFQLIDAIRMRALPVKNPQELAIIKIADRKWGSGRFTGRWPSLSNPLWEQIRDRQEAFSAIAAWSANTWNLATGGEVRNAQGLWVSGDFFRVVGVPAAMGRVLTPEDDRPGCAAPAAVISHAFWQGEYGGDAAVIGKKLTLEGHPFEIVGVTPPDFYGVDVGRSFDVAVPVCSEKIIRAEQSMLEMRHGWWLASIGRLKPDWSHDRATAHLKAISPAMLEATLPPVYNAEGAKKYSEYRLGAFPADTGFSDLREDYENPLWLLMGTAGLVLLIACANLANLLLARASGREREIAVRMALGASRGRLIRQLLVECLLLLCAVGAALGAALAQNLSRFLVTFLSTQGSPLFVDLRPDWRLFAFAAGMAALTCLLFGLAPAIRATRVAAGAALKATGRGMTAGRERFSLRRALVVSQVAMSVVLLVGALLFARSLGNLLTLDAGFRQSGILITNLDMTRLNLPVERRQEYKRELLERVRGVPGVDAAADTTIVPVSGSGWNQYVMIDGKEEQKGLANLTRVSPGYFRTLETPILAGRDFDARDTATSPRVAIVSEEFSRKLLNGANPAGRRFQIEEYAGEARPIYEIVGLVKDAKYRRMQDDFTPTVFVPAAQETEPDTFTAILVRSNLPVAGVMAGVKRAVGEASPQIDIQFQVFSTQIRESLLRERLMATLSGFFGFLAAVLATLGLYGVTSYTVARRTNEIGLRMALGAQPGDVVRMILREAGVLLAIGLVLGTGLALAAARAASSLLFGLKPHDPPTIGMAMALLAAAAALASFLPARRAARLDPMVALRDE